MGDLTPEARVINQLTIISGLSRNTVSELFSKGWTFEQSINNPIKWYLPLNIEREQNRG